MSVINTNISATIAQNSLVKTNREMQTAMQQLSTGSRINSAKDDAAGLAISSKMTSQINGLNQAVRNANDGISLVQTAEGALIEVTNMMQRMRELAVQSANDTNTAADREALDLEFQELKTEINRIGNNTQFNGTNILDKSFSSSSGTFAFQVGANAAQTISLTLADFRTTSGSTGAASKTTTTTNVVAADPVEAIEAVAQVDTVNVGVGAYAEGDVITVTDGGDNSFSYMVAADDTATEISAGLLAAADDFATALNVTVAVTDGALTFTANVAGTATAGTISVSAVSDLGAPTAETTTVNVAAADEVPAVTARAQVDALSLTGSFTAGDVITVSDGGSNSFSYTVADGDDTDDISAGLLAAADDFAEALGVTVADTGGALTFTANVAGTANSAFTVTVTAYEPDLSDINDSVITSQADSDAAITAIDLSLAVVNNARAEMGATINRLNFAADNLMNVSQNASESRSRILDTDFAATTTELARTQIIAQAGTAMLAQANQQPQSVLALLQ